MRSAEKSRPAPWWRTNAYWLLPVLAALVIYFSSWNYGFVLDDFDAIVDNRFVQQGFAGLSDIWTTEYRAGLGFQSSGLYRPLPLSIFAIAQQLWPSNAAALHVLNILLYVLNVALLAIWVSSWPLRNARTLAGISALLFAVLPIHTEVVANIKSADELLAFAFGFGALLLIARTGTATRRSRVLSGILFLAAMLSKESAVMLVFIIPAMRLLMQPNDTGWREALKSSLARLTPWLLAVGVFLYLRHNALGSITAPASIPMIDNMLSELSYVPRLWSAIALAGLYVWKTVVPLHLSHDYSIGELTPSSIADPAAWLSIVFFALTAVLCLRYRKQYPELLMAFIMLVVPFVLVSNAVILIGTHFGERLFYLPSSGAAILLAWLMLKGYDRVRKDRWRITAAGLILCAAYTGRSMDRVQDWQSEQTLFEADVISAPMSTRTHYRLGRFYNKMGLQLAQPQAQTWFQRALPELNRAIELFGENGDAFNERGLALQNLGKTDEARRDFEKVLSMEPGHVQALNNLGTICFQAGDYPGAILWFGKAHESAPLFRDAMGNLGSVYGTMGEYEESIHWFEKALAVDPRYAPYYYFIALSYDKLGQPARAKEFEAKAYALDPSLRR